MDTHDETSACHPSQWHKVLNSATKNMMDTRNRWTALCATIAIASMLCWGYAANEQQQTAALHNVVITLERTMCFGTCPVYTVTVYGDGKVIFEGQKYVKVTGRRTARISPQQVRQLIAEFDKAHYFALQDRYYAPNSRTDFPSAITSITIGARTKTVDHYLGDSSAPPALTNLEDKIDAIVNTKRWIR